MAETKMQLVDWLDDLCVRFIINLPHEELTSVERICFQIEEAQWFYEDFIRAQDPTMPAMNLRRFCELIFQHCPLLAPFSASATLSYAEFLAYKTRVPVRGAILVNEDMSEVVLVKGWSKKAKWSFPRGKINKEEKDLDCAIREVYEETGFDVRGAGLVDENEDNVKAIDMSLREQQMRLYVFRGVPMDTVFEPKTRKEISKIQWYKISDLANTSKGKEGPIADGMKSSQFYMVAPFIKPLRTWIKHQRALDKQQRHLEQETEEEGPQASQPILFDDGMITTDAEDDGHFQRLLSGLHKQQPEAELPEVHAPASTADLSAELKRMLSVGGPAMAQPQQRHVQDNSLLSLLRGTPPGPPHQPPRTPLDQIVNVQPQVHTPHHHHPNPPPYSEMAPPPAFPSPQVHGHQGQPLPYEQTFPVHWQGNMNQGLYHGQHSQNLSQLAVQHSGPPQTLQQRGVLGSTVPEPPPPQILNPLQTGDPAFHSQFSQYNQSPQQIPTAKPPPHKLTNHALGLLNVFKSPNPAPIQTVSTRTDQLASQLPEVAPLYGGSTNAATLPSHISTGGIYVPDRFDSPPELHPLPAQKTHNSHQDSLLSLFRGAVPSASQKTGLAPSGMAPVELAAQPSPHVVKGTTLPVEHKLSMRRLSNMNSPPSQSNLRQHPSSSQHDSDGFGPTRAIHADLTSATVSGPLNAPDFDTVKKSQPQRPVEIGNGAISPSTYSAAQYSPTAQMTGYPTGSMPNLRGSPQRAAAIPSVPMHFVTNKTTMEAPRPFHPTSILRRSAQDIADMAQAEGAMSKHIQPIQQAVPQKTNQPRHQVPSGSLPTQAQNNPVANFDRRSEAPEGQKNALLSLFGSPPGNASTHNTTQSSNSKTVPTSFPISMPTALVTGGPASNAANFTGNPLSTLLASGNMSGITSPVSPIPGNMLPPKRGNTDPVSTTSNSAALAAGHSHSNAFMQAHYGSGDTPRSSRISSIASLQGSLHSPSGLLHGEPPVQPQQSSNAPTSAPGYSNYGFSGTPGGVSISTLGIHSKPTPPIQGPGGSARGSLSFPGIEGLNSGAATGTQSPITPIEKNFLMGYLQGVVKEGAGRRASGGGSTSSR